MITERIWHVFFALFLLHLLLLCHLHPFFLTHHLFFSSPSNHLFFTHLDLALYLALSFNKLFSLPSLQLFLSIPLSLSPHHTFPCSSALPWWYLIAVKQEAGEQTAGEPTLILSCAICCGHMTVLHARSNAMMPHHTWHINQSWPMSRREREGKREWDIKKTVNTINMNRYISLFCNFSFFLGIAVKTSFHRQHCFVWFSINFVKILFMERAANKT